MKRSPGSWDEEAAGSAWGAAGEETKSLGAAVSTGAGDGMKNCGVEATTGVVAGNVSSGGIMGLEIGAI